MTTRNLVSGRDQGLALFVSRPCVIAIRQFSCLTVTGQDAATFLQGQTTCDVLGLHNNRATPGAICNPKGRVLSTFLMFMREPGYRLILPEILAAAIEKKLRMYVLRSRVSIENRTNSIASFGLSCNALPERFDPTHAQSGDARYPVINTETWQIVKASPNQWLFIGASDIAAQQWTDLVGLDGFAETGNEYWNLLSILNGIPTLGTETTEAFVPQMINLDALGGISFQKGCYTGQEIIARMHYLGKLKRRMVLAASRSEKLPAPGDPVYDSEHEQSIGQIVNAEFLETREIRMLAVLQIDRIESDSLHLFDPEASGLKILDLPYPV
ncbi:MAG: folate-binding protein [Methylococcaceae bacterium]|nr:folate-binding protein [Methylococcaceae bacterium]